MIYPKGLQENSAAQFYYIYIRLVVSMVVVSLGGNVASNFHGFQTAFKFLDSAGHFPYYKIIYYGAVSQAAFGSGVVTISVVCFLVCDLCGN